MIAEGVEVGAMIGSAATVTEVLVVIDIDENAIQGVIVDQGINQRVVQVCKIV